MKKFLALLLILVLSFSCFGCGNDGDTAADGDGTTVVEGNEDGEGTADGTSEDGSSVAPGDTVNPDDLTMGENAGSDLEAEYDFEFSYSDSFGLSGMVKKLDYSDLSAVDTELESRMSSAISGSIGGEYEIFSSYEPYEEEEIDELTCAAAMEEGESDGRYLEGGVYHTQSSDDYYQYICFYTENFTEVNSDNTASIIKLAKNTMGLDISKKKMQKAIETAFDTATDTLDEYTLLDEVSVSGKNYDEVIRVAVIATVTEDNEISYYAYFERERNYN